MKKLVEVNNLDSGNIYMQITRGDGRPRNHNYLPYEEQNRLYQDVQPTITETIRKSKKV